MVWGLDLTTFEAWVQPTKNPTKIWQCAHYNSNKSVFSFLHTLTSSSYLFASKHNKHKHTRKQEAGCQRGTNTHQCWPPLQLRDIIQVHKCTKNIKKEVTSDNVALPAFAPLLSSASRAAISRSPNRWAHRGARWDRQTDVQTDKHHIIM